MNRKRFHRYHYPSHPLPTLLTTTTTAIFVATTIVLAVLSPTVYSRVYQPPHKLQSSCATIVPRQTVAVSRHFRSTETHVITAADSEYSRPVSTMHHRRRRYVARLIGYPQRQLYNYLLKVVSEVPKLSTVRSILKHV